jgi:hypothetical protein
VAVFLFETGEEFSTQWVAGRNKIYTVSAGDTECTVHSGTKTDSCFSHTDHQYRTGKIRRYFRCQALEAGRHDRGTHGYMATEYFRDKEECPLGIPALGKAK